MIKITQYLLVIFQWLKVSQSNKGIGSASEMNYHTFKFLLIIILWINWDFR